MKISPLFFAATLVAGLQFSSTALAQSGDHMHMKSGSGDKMLTEHYEAEAVINSVNLDARTINASHGPIPALSWPAMTMSFAVTDDVNLESLTVGDTVTIMLQSAGNHSYIVYEVR